MDLERYRVGAARLRGSPGSDDPDPDSAAPRGACADPDVAAQTAPPSAFQSAVGAAQDTKGFLPALFDFTFTHFVTPKLVRFVYLLATIALGIVWLFWVFVGFARARAPDSPCSSSDPSSSSSTLPSSA